MGHQTLNSSFEGERDRPFKRRLKEEYSSVGGSGASFQSRWRREKSPPPGQPQPPTSHAASAASVSLEPAHGNHCDLTPKLANSIVVPSSGP